MRQITSAPNEDDSPAWSPDGRQIAFVSVHGDVSDIFVMNADGTKQHNCPCGTGTKRRVVGHPDQAWCRCECAHHGAAKDLPDYQRLTAEGKLGEAGQKLEQLKRELDELNARQK
jgi:hypothetical protein